jgi:hypothetical protein
MKKLIRDIIQAIADRLSAGSTDRLGRYDRENQILLALKYRELRASKHPLPSFAEVEFSRYSQNGEDGILLYVFSLIGTTNRRTVEACAGDGIECNSANLIINHGWEGLLFDGNEEAVRKGNKFYQQRTNAWKFRRLPPQLIHAWITRDNIDDLISSHGVAGEIDLLSLDMDGVDYWIWKSIVCIMPRVVVVEYNNRWSASQSVTIPYTDNFSGEDLGVDGAGYFGASLGAFNKLAKEKGYRLIGANSPNTNAIFLRGDVGKEFFNEVSVESCLASSYSIHQHQTKYPLIKDKPVIYV